MGDYFLTVDDSPENEMGITSTPQKTNPRVIARKYAIEFYLLILTTSFEMGLF